jgi:UDP-glucose 4-epimerase
MAKRIVFTGGSGKVFNAVNDTITTREDTATFLKALCPQIPLKRPMVGNEAPLSNANIREEHDWRKYV